MLYITHGTNDFKKAEKTLKLQWGAGLFGVPLPEFGVSERISDAMGISRNQQGGSNLRGNSIVSPVPASQTSSAVRGSGGTLPGFNSGVGSSSPTGGRAPAPVPTPASGGGGGSGPARDPHINPATGVWDDEYYARNNQPNEYEKIRGTINSGFDSYVRSLDEQLGLLPEKYDNLMGNITNLYGGQKGTIDINRTNQNASLDKANTDVDTGQVKTLRSLSDTFRQSLDAGNTKLGSLGASDSSATPMYSYALSLQDNKNRGNVLEQTNAMKNDIQLKRTQVNSTLDDEINKLDTWKNSQLSDLATWLQDNKSKIAGAKGIAERERSTALANVDMSALSRLQQLDDQFTNYKQSLSQWALGHQSQLDTVLASIGKIAQVDAPKYVQQGIDSAIDASRSANPADLFGYNPFGTSRKTDRFGNPI